MNGRVEVCRLTNEPSKWSGFRAIAMSVGLFFAAIVAGCGSGPREVRADSPAQTEAMDAVAALPAGSVGMEVASICPSGKLADGSIAGGTVAIKAASRRQTIDGFGSSLRVFDDPHVTETFDSTTQRAGVVISPSEQAAILDLLYRDLGLTRARPVLEGRGLQPVRSAPFDFSWKKNDAHIDLVKAASQKGVDTYFLSPVTLETWMSEADPDAYVEWAMAILRRWRDLGVRLPYHSVVNEPGYVRSGYWSGQFIRDVIKRMGPRLRQEGFDTKFVITDDLNATQAFERSQIILADPEARSYVGALAFHLYEEPLGNAEKIQRLAAQYGLPLWMTEYSVTNDFEWANIIFDLMTRFDVSAIDYMWGFFGQWDNGTAYVTLRNQGDRYLGVALPKRYYLTGQFSRYVRPGSVRVDSTSSLPDVKSAAFVDGRAGTVTVVLMNNGNSNVEVAFTIEQASIDRVTTAVRTSGTENWAAVPVSAVTENCFSAPIKAGSVTTFVAKIP